MFTTPYQPQSLSGKTVTVFGGTGFVGRYVVKRLADLQARIIIATRTPQKAYFLRPYGTVGQIVPQRCNIRDEASVRHAIENSDAVINLIGVLFDTRRNSFDRVHHKFPSMLARLCKKTPTINGQKRQMIHISAIGAKEGATCRYLHSKALGENAIHEYLPHAVILRPSIIFGAEDNFFNRFARMAGIMPFLPLIGGGKTRFQPVFVGDVADAVIMALSPHRQLENPAGKIYELGGTEILTFRQLMEKTLEYSGRKAFLMPIPWFLAKFQSYFLQLLPNPLLTRDQVEALKYDNIVHDEAKKLVDLGIRATLLDTVLPDYMHIYRRYVTE